MAAASAAETASTLNGDNMAVSGTGARGGGGEGEGMGEGSMDEPWYEATSATGGALGGGAM